MLKIHAIGGQKMNNKLNVFNIISWLFGAAVFAIGLVNTFWGNDPGFGLFLLVLALLYLPPINLIIEEKIRFSIPRIVKIGLGIFIIWALLGVGELFDKIDLMMMGL